MRHTAIPPTAYLTLDGTVIDEVTLIRTMGDGKRILRVLPLSYLAPLPGANATRWSP